MFFKKIPISLLTCSLCVSCMDMSCMKQYNPRDFWNKLKQERITAHKVQPSLTKEGKLPTTKKLAQQPTTESKADQNYKALCVSCHGINGDGNTPLGLALKPKPRPFTDKKWQAQVSDAHISKVIKEGGASVGLSATMAPWGGVISDQEIKEIVVKIRNFATK